MEPRFKPRAARWEARMLPLSYAGPPPPAKVLDTCLAFITNFHDSQLAIVLLLPCTIIEKLTIKNIVIFLVIDNVQCSFLLCHGWKTWVFMDRETQKQVTTDEELKPFFEHFKKKPLKA